VKSNDADRESRHLGFDIIEAHPFARAGTDSKNAAQTKQPPDEC
jgi:hypothetical protein